MYSHDRTDDLATSLITRWLCPVLQEEPSAWHAALDSTRAGLAQTHQKLVLCAQLDPTPPAQASQRPQGVFRACRDSTPPSWAQHPQTCAQHAVQALTPLPSGFSCHRGVFYVDMANTPRF